MQLENGSHLVSGKPGFKGRGVIMRREQKIDKSDLEVSLGAGIPFWWGVVPGGGQGDRAEEGSGVFIHCLDCLLESGFWKKQKTKSPATRHLCLCERPWLQSYLVVRVWDLVYVDRFVYLYQAPKELYLRAQCTSFSQVLVCIAPEMWESQMFSRVRIPRTASQPYSSSRPFLIQLRHPVRPRGQEGVNQQLCVHQHLSERPSLGFRHQREIQR